MTPPVPIFDVEHIAQQLGADLNRSRAIVAPTIATPADTPMFHTAPDGAVLDRAGNVVQPPPPPAK